MIARKTLNYKLQASFQVKLARLICNLRAPLLQIGTTSIDYSDPFQMYQTEIAPFFAGNTKQTKSIHLMGFWGFGVLGFWGPH